MNCKPGDMAILVSVNDSSQKTNIGAIVEVLRVHDFERWIVDLNGSERTALDKNLRPIRPDESPEESTEAMRLLTQLPQKEKV